MHAAAVRNNRKPTPPSWTASFSADLPPFLQLSLYCTRVTSELLSSRTNVRDLKISPYGRNDRNPGFQPFAVQKVSKKSLNTSSREVLAKIQGVGKNLDSRQKHAGMTIRGFLRDSLHGPSVWVSCCHLRPVYRTRDNGANRQDLPDRPRQVLPRSSPPPAWGQ